VKAELFLDNGQTDKELIISFTEAVHGACLLSQSRSVCDARVCRVVDALPSISQVASCVCEMSESFVSVIWHDCDVYTFRNHKDSGQNNLLPHLRLAESWQDNYTLYCTGVWVSLLRRIQAFCNCTFS